MVDLILFEGLKIFFPLHYALVRDNQNLFIKSYNNATEGRKILQEKFAAASIGLTDQQTKDVKTLVQALFPHTQAVWSTYYYSFDPKWVKDRRITTEEYFLKYLTFAVVEGHVSDREFDQMIVNIRASDGDTAVDHLSSVLTTNNADDFIKKLRYRENDFTIEESKKLSLGLSKLGHQLEKGIGFEASTSSFGQAAILIKRLIWNIKEENDRYNQAISVFANANPIQFSFEILKWLPVRSDSETGENFSESQIFQFEDFLVQRTKSYSGELPFFSLFPEETNKIVQYWSRKHKDELVQYLSNYTNESLDHCISFLKALVGKVYSRTLSPNRRHSSKPHEQVSDFTKDSYDFLVEATGTAWLAEAITKWGKVAHDDSTVKLDTKFSDGQSDDNLIQQFYHWERNSALDQSGKS